MVNTLRLAPRYRIALDAEVADVGNTRVWARTWNLSLSGCAIRAVTTFREGTSVRVKLTHAKAEVLAFGHIVYARLEWGTGIEFTKMDPKDAGVLAQWIEELREKV